LRPPTNRQLRPSTLDSGLSTLDSRLSTLDSGLWTLDSGLHPLPSAVIFATAAEIPHIRGIFLHKTDTSDRIRLVNHGVVLAHLVNGSCVMRLRYAGFALLFVATACVPMSKVPLQATPGALEILAGEWEGQYESAALGRRGSIEFTLKAGTDDAHGEVLMVPRGTNAPYQPSQYYEGQAQPYLPSSERLTIRFIRASNGSLHGMLDRYWDPDRNCYALTTFDGRLEADVVEGTFTTSACGAGGASGTWKATKKRAKASQARR
jgi:hypothetical protein